LVRIAFAISDGILSNFLLARFADRNMFVRFLGVGPGHWQLLESNHTKFQDVWQAFSPGSVLSGERTTPEQEESTEEVDRENEEDSISVPQGGEEVQDSEESADGSEAGDNEDKNSDSGDDGSSSSDADTDNYGNEDVEEGELQGPDTEDALFDDLDLYYEDATV
jgi:hypothetical protein